MSYYLKEPTAYTLEKDPVEYRHVEGNGGRHAVALLSAVSLVRVKVSKSFVFFSRSYERRHGDKHRRREGNRFGFPR